MRTPADEQGLLRFCRHVARQAMAVIETSPPGSRVNHAQRDRLQALQSIMWEVAAAMGFNPPDEDVAREYVFREEETIALIKTEFERQIAMAKSRIEQATFLGALTLLRRMAENTVGAGDRDRYPSLILYGSSFRRVGLEEQTPAPEPVPVSVGARIKR